jgi:uncharacterized membrane protein
MAEGDEALDNSLGRLLALSDGIFAIAMTLLALDLRLPDLGAGATDAQLRHALTEDWRAYLAFFISFNVAAQYWGHHRRAMRDVTALDGALVGRTLLVLLLVAALPFPASVLANHGDLPTGLAFYSVFNVVANLALLRLVTDRYERERVWANIAVLLLCVPGAYVLQDNGPWLLLLLIVSARLPRLRRRMRRPA